MSISGYEDHLELQNWRWDGEHISDLLEKANIFIKGPEQRLLEYQHTVPEGYRTSVARDVDGDGATSALMILAIDKRGQVLVMDTYQSPESPEPSTRLMVKSWGEAKKRHHLLSFRQPQKYREFINSQYEELSDGMKKLYGSEDKFQENYIKTHGFDDWLTTIKDFVLDFEHMEDLVKTLVVERERELCDLPSMLAQVSRLYNVDFPVEEGIFTPKYWEDHLNKKKENKPKP